MSQFQIRQMIVIATMSCLHFVTNYDQFAKSWRKKWEQIIALTQRSAFLLDQR